ncbi:hypothetical protein BH23GEM2_BH23GEM2_25010 [soil metagenome]
MTRRSRLWLALASVFTLVNMGGAGIAAARGEGLHTAVHIVLLLLGTYVVWHLLPRAARQQAPGLHSAEGHVEQLEQSVDSIALQVERIGEAQRFMVRLQQERSEANAEPQDVPRT